MKAVQLSLILVFIFTLSFEGYTQPLKEASYDQMVEVAAETHVAGDYVNALEWYEKAYKESKDQLLMIPISQLYYQLRDYEKAESKLKRLLDKDDENIFKDQRFLYAQTLKQLGKYDEAITEYNIFIAETENEPLEKRAQRELAGIDNLSSMATNVEVAVRFAGDVVNTASGEASPSLYRDGKLYYSSYNRRNKINLEEEDDDYHAKIFTSKKNEDSYDKPEELGEHINRKGFHSTNPAFTEDGRVMFFTRSQLSGSVSNYSKIYQSFSKDEGWSPAVETEGVNGDYLAKHPYPGELFGQDVLYFVSDMEGGYGGFDIYYSTANSDGTYKSPVNLGEKINTDKDEITPFYQDGTLYFSSNGHPTTGGFDTFESTWDGTGWSKATNMGLSYNTSFDDLYLRFNPDESSGFIVSNRPDDNKKNLESPTCCDDIYNVTIRKIVIDILATTLENGNPLNGATVGVENLTAPLEYSTDKRTMPDTNKFQFLLDPDFEYQIFANKKGYFGDTLTFNTAGIYDNYTIKAKLNLEAKPPELIALEEEQERIRNGEDPDYVTEIDGNDGDSDGGNGTNGGSGSENPGADQGGSGDGPVFETVYETVSRNEAIRLNSIYYDFDDDKILRDAEIDLNIILDLMRKYPQMKIELSSHTDSQGKTKYNEALSQRRADSAKRWLTKNGIKDNKIVAKGYGETQILNHCTNNKKCSDEEHRVNRRTEFRILEGPQTLEIKRTIIKGGPKYEHQGGQQSFYQQDPIPVITFDKGFVDLGNVKKGESREIKYHFTNTGDAELIIEVVTACKCTELDWPKKPVPPGGKGIISAVYDSTNSHGGEVTKVIDIIANTKPIVVEAKFKVNVIE